MAQFGDSYGVVGVPVGHATPRKPVEMLFKHIANTFLYWHGPQLTSQSVTESEALLKMRKNQKIPKNLTKSDLAYMTGFSDDDHSGNPPAARF